MPPAEVEVTPGLVTQLLESQRPGLAGLPVRALAFGWDNISFRVGEELVARFPRRVVAVGLLGNEARWLPDLAPRLPLPIPVPVFVGEPGHEYPWHWSLVPWIPGESSATAAMDPGTAITDPARFLGALHVPAPRDAPADPFRGVPLASRDDATRERARDLNGMFDESRLLARWDEALAAPVFERESHWLHGDLHPHNLLVLDGRLSGVIDFGDVTAGDPATDLAVAWMLFPSEGRARSREIYGGDDAMWARARGWALSLGLTYLANSGDNPTMCGIGVATMERVVG